MDRKGNVLPPSSTSRHVRTGSAGATMASGSGRRVQSYTARAAAQRLAKAMASKTSEDDDLEDDANDDVFLDRFQAPSRGAPAPQVYLLLRACFRILCSLFTKFCDFVFCFHVSL